MTAEELFEEHRIAMFEDDNKEELEYANMYVALRKKSYLAGYEQHVKEIQERATQLMSQSFTGWSEDAINGYTTAIYSILK